MNAENFNKVLTEFQEARPFIVFTVETTGGRLVEVDHPGAMIVRGGVATYLGPGGRPFYFDHKTVAMFHPMSRSDVRKADTAEASEDATS